MAKLSNRVISNPLHNRMSILKFHYCANSLPIFLRNNNSIEHHPKFIRVTEDLPRILISFQYHEPILFVFVLQNNNHNNLSLVRL